jgi:hypothetical protein
VPLSFPLPAGSPQGRTALGLLIYAAAFALPAAAASDPFSPGLAWSRAADATDPWIARSVVLAADDNLVWAASGGGAAHLDLFSLHAPANAGAPAAPLWRDDSIAAAVGTPIVAAAREGAALFSVAQLPGPTTLQRRTVVARHDPASAVPHWTYDPSILTNGPARIATDAKGDLVVMALWIQLTSTVEIAWLSGSTGARLAHATVSAPNLSQVALSADGSTTLVSAGLHVWAFDATGAVVHHEALTASTPAIAISATGNTFAVGGMGALRVFTRQSAGYALVREIAGEAGELAARCALSDDARTLAIGWWRYTNGVDLRCDVWDLALGVRRFTRAQQGTPGGLQNLPESVCVTPDGSRAAFGCWGDGTSAPDLLLVDVASGTTRLEIDLEGSVHALALDARGTRVALAMKHTHANQLGNTGEIRVYDSGERDLVVFGQPRVGGTLELAAKRANASLCVFMYGLPRSEPLIFPGIPGALWLKRARLISIPVLPDASRRADLSIAIPADPSLAGRQWHMQAAFRVNGTLVFGDSRVDPLIL